MACCWGELRANPLDLEPLRPEEGEEDEEEREVEKERAWLEAQEAVGEGGEDDEEEEEAEKAAHPEGAGWEKVGFIGWATAEHPTRPRDAMAGTTSGGRAEAAAYQPEHGPKSTWVLPPSLLVTEFGFVYG